jgi:hypothetical protein
VEPETVLLACNPYEAELCRRALALKVLASVRRADSSLPVFLLVDRDGRVPDEEVALRLGATRLFLRPIEVRSLVDAIRRLAV